MPTNSAVREILPPKRLTFAGWAGPSSAVLAVEGVSPDAAERLEGELVGPRKGVKGLTARREGAWLTVRWQGKPGELREALRKR